MADYLKIKTADGYSTLYSSFPVDVPIKTGVYQSKTVTPSVLSQTISPDSGYDALSGVTVNGDVNLISGNIKKDITIFGVTGTFESDGTSTAGSLIVCNCTSDIGSVTARYGSSSVNAYMSNNVAYVVIPYTYTGIVYLDGYTGSVIVVTSQVTITSINKYTCILSTESVIYNAGVWCDELATHTWNAGTSSSNIITENSDSISVDYNYSYYTSAGESANAYHERYYGARIGEWITRKNYTKLRYTYSDMESTTKNVYAFGYINQDTYEYYEQHLSDVSDIRPYVYLSYNGSGGYTYGYNIFSVYTKIGDTNFDQTNKTVTVDINSSDNIIYLGFVFKGTITKIEFI